MYEQLQKVIEKRNAEVRIQEINEKMAQLTLERLYWEEQLSILELKK